MIVAEFIASYRTEHGIPHAIACRALQVSQSWFYTHINRTPTSREQRRARLEEEIRRLFTASGGTYGSPRICDELREAGWKVSVNTVAARMAEFGLAGRRVKRRRSTARTGRRPAALDLVAATSPPWRRMCCGAGTSPRSTLMRGLCIWPRCRICSHGGCSATP
ncbi:IS3 family transposase [Actinomadura madurae]|uniref:IS3 family transposase n=1 Tax=Actinomadura madurae TaxID=1993 RepID=UPI0020D2333B|nr:IS3 family transposase [Actinomadura madurae]MCP9955735.1 IS3 family transposase [Actinomadura madurae]MCQ0003462.1 IS3 family transposase [Actinomadura madurae]MCQ0021178.1 IS3 family transposase [Actinomadura madurae]